MGTAASLRIPSNHAVIGAPPPPNTAPLLRQNSAERAKTSGSIWASTSTTGPASFEVAVGRSFATSGQVEDLFRERCSPDTTVADLRARVRAATGLAVGVSFSDLTGGRGHAQRFTRDRPDGYLDDALTLGDIRETHAKLLPVLRLWELPWPPLDDDHGVVIRTLAGAEFFIACGMGDTAGDIKRLISAREGVPEDQMRLVFEGKQLRDGWRREDMGIVDGSVLFLILRLRGG